MLCLPSQLDIHTCELYLSFTGSAVRTTYATHCPSGDRRGLFTLRTAMMSSTVSKRPDAVAAAAGSSNPSAIEPTIQARMVAFNMQKGTRDGVRKPYHDPSLATTGRSKAIIRTTAVRAPARDALRQATPTSHLWSHRYPRPRCRRCCRGDRAADGCAI